MRATKRITGLPQGHELKEPSKRCAVGLEGKCTTFRHCWSIIRQQWGHWESPPDIFQHVPKGFHGSHFQQSMDGCFDS